MPDGRKIDLSVIFAQNLALQGGDVAQGRRNRPVGR